MTRRRVRWPVLGVFALALLVLVPGRLVPSRVRAQEAQETPLAAPVDVEVELAALAEAELSEEERETVQRVLEETRPILERAAERAAAASGFELQAAAAPQTAERLRAELAQAPDSPELAVDVRSDAAEISEALARADAERAAADQRVQELTAETDERDRRRAALVEESTRLESEIRRLEEELGALPDPDPDALARARRLQQAARVFEAVQTRRAVEAELDSILARRELLPLERDQAQRRRTRAELEVEALGALGIDRRRIEAEAAARAANLARQRAEDRPAIVQELALENGRLADRRLGPDSPSGKLDRWNAQREELRARARELSRSHRRLRLLVDIGDTEEVLAGELRRQYESLGDPAELAGRVRELESEIASINYQRFEFEEELDEWGDVERAVQDVLDGLDPELAEDERAGLADEVRGLLSARRETLIELIADCDRVADVLVDVWRLTHDLAEASLSYGEFIGEHILWVRSVDPGRTFRFRATPGAVAWLVDPSAWRRGLGAVGAEVQAEPFGPLGLLILVALLGGSRRALRRRLQSHAERVRSWRSDSFLHTLRALLDTVLLAAWWPALLATAGWFLRLASPPEPLLFALGEGLVTTAFLLYPVTLLRNVCAKEGLGAVHFRWPEPAVAALRRNLNWFVPVFIVTRILAQTFEAQEDARWSDSAGRLAFCVQLIALAWLLMRVLRPTGPALADYLRRNRGGWIDRLRPLWFGLAVGLPLVGVVVALTGWYYTAFSLELRLQKSLDWILGLVLVNALLQRWLLVARRRLSLEQARARARARADAEPGEEPHLDEIEVDIPALDAQTRQLFRTGIGAAVVVGLWLIWSGVLPALRVLERVQLWPEVRMLESAEFDALDQGAVASAVASEDGSTEAAESATPALGGRSLPTLPATPQGDGALIPVTVVTLGDLSLMVLILLAMGIAARNLPSLIEFALLQRLPLDRGARFAITSIVRYLIVIVGTTWALAAIGIGWSKVQWLAAALTFGLAFGLQEIFANFVSGLIILAERPIRIGDMVTVSNIHGKVTRIRMRATTITDLDHRELLVPNKDFITRELVNWTLSDPVTRLVVPVGIEYGSDTRLARKLLLRVASESGLVLDDPRPSAVFLKFGESSLDFELRVYIPNRETWAEVTSDLHLRIDDAFRAADLVIAFPQRDLHVRSVPAGVPPGALPGVLPGADAPARA